MNKNQSGFHFVGLLLVLVVLGVVGFAGYTVFRKQPVAQQSVAQTDHKPNDGQTLPCVPHGHDNYRSNNTLAIDPHNPDTMYIAIEFKGVFKSTDGGKTWQQRDQGIAGYAKESDPSQRCIQEFGRLLIDPQDPNHLLLSRVESPGTGKMPFSENAGLWESKDAGASWKQLIKPDMNMSGSKAITFAPGNPSTIYYGINNGRPSYLRANDPYESPNKTGVLYRTANGGRSWTELPTGADMGLRALGIGIDPRNANNIWLFTMSQSDGDFMPQEQQRGPMRTTDGGKTWTSFAQQLPAGYRNTLFGVANPQDGNNAYVIQSDRNRVSTGFRTINGGASWQRSNYAMLNASYDINDPSGNRLLGYEPFQVQPGIFESTDKGLTWRRLSPVPPEANNSDQLGVRVESIVFSPNRPGTIYMNGSRGLIWKSTDNGKTWQVLTTLDSFGGPNKTKTGQTEQPR